MLEATGVPWNLQELPARRQWPVWLIWRLIRNPAERFGATLWSRSGTLTNTLIIMEQNGNGKVIHRLEHAEPLSHRSIGTGMIWR
jgi:hypothetical protein